MCPRMNLPFCAAPEREYHGPKATNYEINLLAKRFIGVRQVTTGTDAPTRIKGGSPPAYR